LRIVTRYLSYRVLMFNYWVIGHELLEFLVSKKMSMFLGFRRLLRPTWFERFSPTSYLPRLECSWDIPSTKSFCFQDSISILRQASCIYICNLFDWLIERESQHLVCLIILYSPSLISQGCIIARLYISLMGGKVKWKERGILA